MSAVDYVRRLLTGCNVEDKLQEAVGIVRTLVEAYANGELDDNTLGSYVYKFCTGVQVLAGKCGKPVVIDTCVNELVGKIKDDAAVESFKTLTTELRKSRKSRGEKTGGVPSIL